MFYIGERQFKDIDSAETWIYNNYEGLSKEEYFDLCENLIEED